MRGKCLGFPRGDGRIAKASDRVSDDEVDVSD